MWYPPRLPILLARCRYFCAAGNAGCARPVSRAVWRFASRPCLLDVSAVCLDTIAPAISSLHLIAHAWLRSAPCVPRLCFAVISSLVSSHCVSLPAPLHRHDGRGDTTELWRFSSAHHLIRSPFPRRLASSSSAGSSVRPLPRIDRLPAPFDKRDGAAQSAGDHRLAGGWRRASDGWRRLLACLGWRRAAGGHRRRLAAGGGRGRGCLLASGRWTGRLGRPLIVSFPLSSSHPIGSVPAHPHHLIISSLIISSTGRPSFPFRPTPSRLLFSACLLWLVPPSPAGGCEGYDMGCGGWRLTGLLAFSSPVPLSRCRSFARCYMPCVARAARSFLGRRGEFYGLF